MEVNARGSADDTIAAVATALTDRVVNVAGDVQEFIEQLIPELRDDSGDVHMLGASVAENVTAIIDMLRYGVDSDSVEAPMAAVEYARRLAQRGVESAALVRAYRVGQTRFTRLLVDAMMENRGSTSIDGPAMLQAVEQVSGYIDRVVGQVLHAYEAERAQWFQNRGVVLSTTVRQILKGESVDVDRLQATLAYRLRHHHVGAVVWMEQVPAGGDSLQLLRSVVDHIADAVGASKAPLVVPVDETSVWVWLPATDVPVAAVEQAIGRSGVAVSVALGAATTGMDGFRRTHRQAISAQRVAVARGAGRDVVTPFAEIAPIAMMAADLDSARSWVSEVLGGLAADSQRNEGLRETARLFLGFGGSYTAAADQLFLHRNTVQYRVRQAEEARGRPFAEGRLDVEVALLACRWLGTAVLAP